MQISLKYLYLRKFLYWPNGKWHWFAAAICDKSFNVFDWQNFESKNSSLVQYTNCVSTSFSKPSLDFLTAHVSLNQRLAWERMPIILFYVTLGIGKHTCVFVYYRFSFENFRIIPKWYSNSLLIFIELACILIVVQLLYNKNNSKTSAENTTNKKQTAV